PILRRRSALRPLEPHADAVLDASPTGEVRAGVAAAVRSLVVLGRWNWLKFVEELSPVEAVLRGDPARVYARMDFASRDHYRHAVAGFSRESGMTEHEVAVRAVRLAAAVDRSEEHTSELQSRENLVCRLLLEKKNAIK